MALYQTTCCSVRTVFSTSGLIILNAWYGKFVTDNSRKHERAKVIDVTVPLQCLVKDSKLILTEASKVRSCREINLKAWMQISECHCVHLSCVWIDYSALSSCLGFVCLVRAPWLLRPLRGGGEEPEGAVSVPRSHASSPVRRHRTTQDTKTM